MAQSVPPVTNSGSSNTQLPTLAPADVNTAVTLELVKSLKVFDRVVEENIALRKDNAVLGKEIDSLKGTVIELNHKLKVLEKNQEEFKQSYLQLAKLALAMQEQLLEMKKHVNEHTHSYRICTYSENWALEMVAEEKKLNTKPPNQKLN